MVKIKINKIPHELPPEAQELADEIEAKLSDWLNLALNSEVEINQDLDPEITVTPDMIDRPADGHDNMEPSVGDHHMGGHGGCGDHDGRKIKILISR